LGTTSSGKSVTALSVMRLFASPPGRIDGGTMMFRTHDGQIQDLARASEPQMRALRGAEIGMIFQEPMTSLNPLITVGEQVAEGMRRHASLNPRLTVAAIVGEACASHGIGTRQDRASLVVRMLEQVGLPAEAMHRFPHEFSGGQRQRIGIARALIVEPAYVIADEPVSALDVSVQAQVINLLNKLQRERGLGMLFISHDLAVVQHVCHRVMVLYLGRVMEVAPVRDLYATPRHPYTRALLSAAPHPDPDRRRTTPALWGEMPQPDAPLYLGGNPDPNRAGLWHRARAGVACTDDGSNRRAGERCCRRGLSGDRLDAVQAGDRWVRCGHAASVSSGRNRLSGTAIPAASRQNIGSREVGVDAIHCDRVVLQLLVVHREGLHRDRMEIRDIQRDDLLELIEQTGSLFRIGLNLGGLQQRVHLRVGIMRGIGERHAGLEVLRPEEPLHAQGRIAGVRHRVVDEIEGAIGVDMHGAPIATGTG
jgi:peptide/nickel transport system ATP-binding protein